MIVQLNGLDNVGEMGFSLKPPKAVRKVVKKALPVLKTVAKVAAVAVPALAIAGKAGIVTKAVKTVGGKVATIARLKKPATIASKVNTLKKSHDKFPGAAAMKSAADAALAKRNAIQQRAAVIAPSVASAAANVIAPAASASQLNTAPTMAPLSVSPGGAPTPAPADSGTAAGTPAGATGAPFIPDAAASVAAAQETNEAPAQSAAKPGLPSWVIPAGVGLLIVGAVVSSKKKGAHK